MSHEGTGPLWRVLGKLGDSPKKSKAGYEARCPAHDDRHRSLSVGVGDDGRVLLTCHGPCSTEQVLSAMGLGWEDLFEKSQAGNPVRRFRLLDTHGHLVAEHVREDVSGDKKIWWESHGKRGLNGTAVTSLPLYRAHAIKDAKGPIVLCEGEKAAQALADVGIASVATVTGADQTPSDESLAVLQGKELWLWPDNDQIGRDHMARIALRIKPAPKWIDWRDAPEKGDAADYLAAGGTVDGISALVSVPRQVEIGARIWRASELMAMRFDAVKWAIPGLLPAGLAILAGRPKLGKSWLGLGWGLDIARGAPVLKKMEVVRGEALYLALEDGFQRMQERLALMLGDNPAPDELHVVTEWPRMNEGGLDLMEQWLDLHPRTRLIVIDTFKKVRPKEKGNARLYDLDYDAIAPVAALARQHNVAIVVVFHTRKGESNDPLEMVSGTLGLSGAADCVLVLRRERGQADASLFVTGRDVEEQDLALRLDKDDELGWALLGNADQFRRSKERQEILNAISTMPGMTPTEIADAIGKARGAVRYLLFAMVRDAEVRVRDGRYLPTEPISSTQTNANTPNTVPPDSTIPISHISTVTALSPVRGVSEGVRNPCRACGLELNPTEAAARYQLHFDCSLPIGGPVA